MNPSLYVTLLAAATVGLPGHPETEDAIADLKTTLLTHTGQVEPQLTSMADWSTWIRDQKTSRSLSDKKPLPTWSVMLTQTTKGLHGQSTKYKAAFRKVMADRVQTLGEVPSEGSLRESIAQYAKYALGLEDSSMTKKPSRDSYLLFKDAIRNLRGVASQRVLEDEMNENEDVIKQAGKTAGTIRTWSMVNLIIMATTLLILVLGFTLWFCWVARRKRIDDSEQRRRAETRAEREAEARIAGQVAHEMIPLVPTAPPPAGAYRGRFAPRT